LTYSNLFPQLLLESKTLVETWSLSKIIDTYSNTRQEDFKYSVWKSNYNLYLIKNWLGNIYSVVEINDVYDFPEDAKYNESKTQSLNALWYYYQTNLKGNVFSWKIEVREFIQ
jgi:hypothetical protein